MILLGILLAIGIIVLILRLFVFAVKALLYLGFGLVVLALIGMLVSCVFII